VGALDVRPSLTSEPAKGFNDTKSLTYLIDAADRIEDGLSVPASLEAIFVAGTALGGARPKGKHAHLDNALASHSGFRLSEKVAVEVIAQVWEKVRAWKVSFEASGVPGDQIVKVASAFRHIDDVSSADVRRKVG
jgi:hypothetical protein